MAAVTIIWDMDDDPDRNVQHIELHGVTKEEADEVLLNPANPTGISQTSGHPITFGWTSTGRYLAVVWQNIQDDPRMIRPVTAYDVDPPKSAKGKKKRKRK